MNRKETKNRMSAPHGGAALKLPRLILTRRVWFMKLVVVACILVKSG